MSVKIKYWCDSGANIHSCRTGTTTFEELGVTKDEWDEMSSDEKEEIMRDIAFDRLDWGYELEEADED